MTNDHQTDDAPKVCDATFEVLCSVESTLRAATMIAEVTPGLSDSNCPPIIHLLTMARKELDDLAMKVSP